MNPNITKFGDAYAAYLDDLAKPWVLSYHDWYPSGRGNAPTGIQSARWFASAFDAYSWALDEFGVPDHCFIPLPSGAWYSIVRTPTEHGDRYTTLTLIFVKESA
jgi:hypothetical protein